LTRCKYLSLRTDCSALVILTATVSWAVLGSQLPSRKIPLRFDQHKRISSLFLGRMGGHHYPGRMVLCRLQARKGLSLSPLGRQIQKLKLGVPFHDSLGGSAVGPAAPSTLSICSAVGSAKVYGPPPFGFLTPGTNRSSTSSLTRPVTEKQSRHLPSTSWRAKSPAWKESSSLKTSLFSSTGRRATASSAAIARFLRKNWEPINARGYPLSEIRDCPSPVD
jgi:hypothetical protein